MVQLKESLNLNRVSKANLFQFHNGSIKGMATAFEHWAKDKFQFHNGSIKGVIIKHFNPGRDTFQFHNGSIKGGRGR